MKFVDASPTKTCIEVYIVYIEEECLYFPAKDLVSKAIKFNSEHWRPKVSEKFEKN